MIIWDKQVIVPALYNRKNEHLVPMWDFKKEGIKLRPYKDYNGYVDEDKDHGWSLRTKDMAIPEYEYEIIDALYDLETGILSTGIEIHANKNVETVANVGEEVMWEKKHKELVKVTISNIELRESSRTPYTGEKMKKYYKEFSKDETLNDKAIYTVVEYKPVYTLSNGVVLDESYNLYKIINDENI